MAGEFDMNALMEALRELSQGPGISSRETFMSLPAANKVYRPELARTAVSSPGDRMFPALRAPGTAWYATTRSDQRIRES
mmetsp:Transcript_18335/g.26642  ORF Transcript_18335/g.26642 Transcript_18335/m.26642 type:complete len:80 (+) Transcript_18335:160-399(+)